MSDPERCRLLLEYILGIKIVSLEYVEKQRSIDISYDSKGIRLDLTVIDDKGIVYNIEIQTSSNRNLPLRIRYYHDILDLDMLQKSANYRELPKCYVIFICTFDFFKKDRYMYTFRNQCQEDSSIFLGDNAVSIVLNTHGRIGNISGELKDVLNYMAGQEPKGKYAKGLDDAVREVKTNEKWRIDYMTYYMKLQDEKIESLRLGELKDKVSIIRKGKGKVSDDILANILDIDKEVFDEIADMIDNLPDWTDEDIAYELLDEEEQTEG